MKNLEIIIAKHQGLNFNEGNYEVGGGLSPHKYASNRHEDAKTDIGKITLGKASQMFKKATGEDLDTVKEVLKNAVPYMEWHHAGSLPKSYGGGMKKTYFLKSIEIVDIAKNWTKYYEEVISLAKEKQKEVIASRELSILKDKFLKKYATSFFRSRFKPAKFFSETAQEMNGKYGWFCSYGKDYNMDTYYSGWVFKSQRKLDEYHKL